MKHPVSILIFLVLALVGTAAEVSITHGPILGRLSHDGIGIWARTSAPGKFRVRYGTNPRKLDQRSKLATTDLAHDNTGWLHLTDLKPATHYYYQLETEAGTRGQTGDFRTLPSADSVRNEEHNPEGLFNFSFEFACGNNQTPGHGAGPALPSFGTLVDQFKGKIDFSIQNGDWLYEDARTFNPDQWRKQTGTQPAETPAIVNQAPTITGVWENYKLYLNRGRNLANFHRYFPSFFTFDDHEILNDVWGAGTPGLRDRLAAFRDIGLQAWHDYLGWANEIPFAQDIHFGVGDLKEGSDILVDKSADFTQINLKEMTTLTVHWGEPDAGVNDNALDDQGGVTNAGVYKVVKVLDKHRLKLSPAARGTAQDAYSIGTLNYWKRRVSNCDFFFLDTKSEREMHDTGDPHKSISMLGKRQRDWLIEETAKSDADFIFVVSSVNFMVPHVGGGKVRATNKDDAWTVFFHERELLIDAWDKLDKPVMVLSGDLHNSFVIEITDNVWEFASGPRNSNNHWYTDEGGRPMTGKFKYGPRECNIRWSTWFSDDIPRDQLNHLTFCVVQVNNVFNNPKTRKSEDRWVAYPRPQVVFQYFDGRTGKLRYAESVTAATKK